ncbi:MAG: ribosome biogenesis GTP-binding protein YihA/YsxC [Rikenellaceae bacterium]
MQINKAEFKCSSEKISQVPKDELLDFAFIGRSNVGKSSLINMLTGHGSLAKVSGTPGKTRLINHFLINRSWYLVDLPGYGYARTSKSKRGEFAKIITNYVTKCEKMHFLFVLVDSRLEPQKIDLNFIEMLAEEGIPFGIIFTKADKLSKTQRDNNIRNYKKRLSETWEELPPSFISSSETGLGRNEILGFVDECIEAYQAEAIEMAEIEAEVEVDMEADTDVEVEAREE